MKNKLVLIIIAIALALPVKAQQQYMANQEPQDHDNAVGGAVAGAVVGGIVGNQLHHNTVAGALIGGLTGALIGNSIDQNNRTVVVQAPPPMPPSPQQIGIVPPPVPELVEYTYGPADRYGRPQYVIVWQWNGNQWAYTSYWYHDFTVWYHDSYRTPFEWRGYQYRNYHHERFERHDHR
jgi:Glycine zipper 2TM domain